MKTASAQNNFISHTLKAGETLSLLAKEYNTNVGDIMRLNNMHADSKLVYGSAIKIPSTQKIKTEARQTPPAKQINVAVDKNAVRHTVVKGETLYSISKQFNVTTEQLKAWNNLTDNSVKLGSDLIVGANNSSTQTNTAAQTKRQRVETSQPAETNNIIQPEQKTETVTVSNVVEEKSVDNADVKTKNEIPDNQTSYNTANKVLPEGGGYFENQFTGKIKRKKHISGVSKTFKTSSGWNDAKYYILADDINPGTIVKLTADNGKSVYAKVLWNMGDLKENNGIDFRISNATAAALNENAASFNLTVYY
jgi:LysM repeat protein